MQLKIVSNIGYKFKRIKKTTDILYIVFENHGVSSIPFIISLSQLAMYSLHSVKISMLNLKKNEAFNKEEKF